MAYVFYLTILEYLINFYPSGLTTNRKEAAKPAYSLTGPLSWCLGHLNGCSDRVKWSRVCKQTLGASLARDPDPATPAASTRLFDPPRNTRIPSKETYSRQLWLRWRHPEGLQDPVTSRLIRLHLPPEELPQTKTAANLLLLNCKLIKSFTKTDHLGVRETLNASFKTKTWKTVFLDYQ